MEYGFKSFAVEACYKRKVSLTPQRLVVLEIVELQKKPVSAYSIKDLLSEQGTALNIATVYRVLEFWCNHGLIHRLAALNKYISCVSPEEQHTHVINCCQKCETTYESCNKQMGIDLDRGPEALGLQYAPNSHLEIPVICISCR